MKSSAIVILIAAAAPLAARAPGTAAPARPAVSITWVRPDRLSPARREALTRVLADAVEGRGLKGVLVKDSRPRVQGDAGEDGSVRLLSNSQQAAAPGGSALVHVRPVPQAAGASSPGESGSTLPHSNGAGTRGRR